MGAPVKKRKKRGKQTREGVREGKKSAVVGHHLLEKASLPWRVIFRGCGSGKKKRQATQTRIHEYMYTYPRVQTRTYRSSDTRNSAWRWRVARANSPGTFMDKLCMLKGRKNAHGVSSGIRCFFLQPPRALSMRRQECGKNARHCFARNRWSVDSVSSLCNSLTVIISALHSIVRAMINKSFANHLIKNCIKSNSVLLPSTRVLFILIFVPVSKVLCTINYNDPFVFCQPRS